MKPSLLMFGLVMFLGESPHAEEAKADQMVRITVKPVSAGTDHEKSSTVSSRKLEILLENREHRRLEGLVLDWKIYGENIRSRKKEVTAKGSKPVNLDADGKLTLETDVAKFTEKEGAVKTTGKGKNRHRVATPDTGTDYAGYAVELKQGGQVIAESSTLGLGRK